MTMNGIEEPEKEREQTSQELPPLSHEEKGLMRTARIVSMLFTPFSIPFLAFLVLFFCTYLRMMPLSYKLLVLGIVYCFTIFLPTFTIFLFRKMNHFSLRDLVERRRRYVPFLLTITSYAFGLVMMYRMRLPWYLINIIWTALVIMVICVVVNLRWKLSEHMAGAGAVIGGVTVFCSLFDYNPVWWLCIFILIAGMLGSARIILRHHSLGEVAGGFIVGLVCSILVLDPFYSVMTRIFIHSIIH